MCSRYTRSVFMDRDGFALGEWQDVRTHALPGDYFDLSADTTRKLVLEGYPLKQAEPTGSRVRIHLDEQVEIALGIIISTGD